MKILLQKKYCDENLLDRMKFVVQIKFRCNVSKFEHTDLSGRT